MLGVSWGVREQAPLEGLAVGDKPSPLPLSLVSSPAPPARGPTGGVEGGPRPGRRQLLRGQALGAGLADQPGAGGHRAGGACCRLHSLHWCWFRICGGCMLRTLASGIWTGDAAMLLACTSSATLAHAPYDKPRPAAACIAAGGPAAGCAQRPHRHRRRRGRAAQARGVGWRGVGWWRGAVGQGSVCRESSGRSSQGALLGSLACTRGHSFTLPHPFSPRPLPAAHTPVWPRWPSQAAWPRGAACMPPPRAT